MKKRGFLLLELMISLTLLMMVSIMIGRMVGCAMSLQRNALKRACNLQKHMEKVEEERASHNGTQKGGLHAY